MSRAALAVVAFSAVVSHRRYHASPVNNQLRTPSLSSYPIFPIDVAQPLSSPSSASPPSPASPTSSASPSSPASPASPPSSASSVAKKIDWQCAMDATKVSPDDVVSLPFPSLLPPTFSLKSIVSGAAMFLLPFFSGEAARMRERLEKHGYVERPMNPDGNCQMRSISDQLYDDDGRKHQDVRKEITEWLSQNERFTVDEDTTSLGDFIDRDQYPSWKNYITYMSREGSWGDHITLVGAAEKFSIDITILSNVDFDGPGDYITYIKPKFSPPKKQIFLSHWHEMHYNSLKPAMYPPQHQA